eukprot:m.486530 g.486530  ORF g.486530 m.486530 type:complete len:59 (-) comp78270_c0_seq1:40-216(-)
MILPLLLDIASAFDPSNSPIVQPKHLPFSSSPTCALATTSCRLGAAAMDEYIRLTERN